MIAEKNRYVTVLKQKAGELRAVRELEQGIWDTWNPLFELLGDEGIDQAVLIQDAIGELSTASRPGSLIFVDFDGIDFLTVANIEAILTGLEHANLIPVPVVTLSSSQNLQTAVRNFIAGRSRRVGMRLFFDEVDVNIATNVNALIASVGIDVAASHLLFDMDFIDSDLVPTVTVAFPFIINQVPLLANWNTVTVLGTGFPKILDIPGASSAVLPRTEWEFFNSVRNGLLGRTNRLDFGDYAVTNPELVEGFNPRTMQVSPKIIYTIANSWIAYKGRSTRRLGFQQTHAMCLELSQRSEFLGANFSAGDQYIFDCGQNTATKGNSGTWKRVGTNHHITFLADQVANTL